MNSHLGKFGLSGESTLLSIGLLSGGQRSRLVLARMAWREPHMYLLDEPTNHCTCARATAIACVSFFHFPLRSLASASSDTILLCGVVWCAVLQWISRPWTP